MQSQTNNFCMKILQEVDEGIQQSSVFILASVISIVLLLISDISVKLKWNMLLKN